MMSAAVHYQAGANQTHDAIMGVIRCISEGRPVSVKSVMGELAHSLAQNNSGMNLDAVKTGLRVAVGIGLLEPATNDDGNVAVEAEWVPGPAVGPIVASWARREVSVREEVRREASIKAAEVANEHLGPETPNPSWSSLCRGLRGMVSYGRCHGTTRRDGLGDSWSGGTALPQSILSGAA